MFLLNLLSLNELEWEEGKKTEQVHLDNGES